MPRPQAETDRRVLALLERGATISAIGRDLHISQHQAALHILHALDANGGSPNLLRADEHLKRARATRLAAD